jgi:hypothetical protein
MKNGIDTDLRTRRVIWPFLDIRNKSEVDAARPDLDHDERLRKRLDGGQARGQQQGGQDGTEERITMQRTLQTHQIGGDVTTSNV